MTEDLFPIIDKKFYEDVGRDDNEFSAYALGFQSGVEYEQSRIHPDLIPIFQLARLWLAGKKVEKDELTVAMRKVVEHFAVKNPRR